MFLSILFFKGTIIYFQHIFSYEEDFSFIFLLSKTACLTETGTLVTMQNLF